jgi:putative DNA primase/helicase
MPVASIIQAAVDAYTVGLSIVPPREDGTKAPDGTWKQYEQQRATRDTLRQWYGPRTGLGTVCGKVSGNLEVLDFDAREVYDAFVALAQQSGLGDLVQKIETGYVEDTPSDGVHWLFYCPTIGGNTKLARRPKRPDEQRDPNDKVKTLIETKGEGGYIILAPSNGKVHPSGGAYRLRAGSFATIPTLTPDERRELHQLAQTFDEMPKAERKRPTSSADTGGHRPGDDFNARSTWADVLTPHDWREVFTSSGTTHWRRPGKSRGTSATTNHGGSDLLVVFSSSTPFETEHGYSKFSAYAVLNHGGDFTAAARDLVTKGYGEPDTGFPLTLGPKDLILKPDAPMPSAEAFVTLKYTVDGIAALRHQAGVFYTYQPDAGAYHERDEPAVRADLYSFLKPAKQIVNKGTKTSPQWEPVPFDPNKSKVENVLDALRGISNLPKSMLPPRWLKDGHGRDPLDILAFPNGLLHIPTRTLYPPTPEFFTLNGLDFPYDPYAPSPAQWLAFLALLWPEDTESIDTLQEVFGYVLTPDTKQQKIAMLVGPKRSGKGLIGRILRRLVGERNACSPTLAAFDETFGKQVLVGKTLAVISDARISGRTDTAKVAETLLSISGEDPQTIARKFLVDWTGTLYVRFLILTNELPRIGDASGALASRFIVLALTESFYGREDPGLFNRFLPELPGILNWALEGRNRLNARGYFLQPTSANELIQEFMDLGSPEATFLRQCTHTKPGATVSQKDLFLAWAFWCQENGRDKPGTAQTFGRNVRAVLPWVTTRSLGGREERERCWEGLELLQSPGGGM